MRSKYGAKKTITDWIRFDSKAESDYYLYLKQQSDIELFDLQPKYILQEKFTTKDWKKIQDIEYVADFYIKYIDGREIVVDVKGIATSDAKLKRKLFMYKYPDKELQWVVKYKWIRVDYFDNEKRKRDNKQHINNIRQGLYL